MPKQVLLVKRISKNSLKNFIYKNYFISYKYIMTQPFNAGPRTGFTNQVLDTKGRGGTKYNHVGSRSGLS